jgi:hypothetical protein
MYIRVAGNKEVSAEVGSMKKRNRTQRLHKFPSSFQRNIDHLQKAVANLIFNLDFLERIFYTVVVERVSDIYIFSFKK